MSKSNLEILCFGKTEEDQEYIAATRATVVSNGKTTISYEESGSRHHRSITQAIAYLEARGYNIIMY